MLICDSTSSLRKLWDENRIVCQTLKKVFAKKTSSKEPLLVSMFCLCNQSLLQLKSQEVFFLKIYNVQSILLFASQLMLS